MSRVRVLVGALVLSAAGFVGITTHEAYRETAYNDGTGVVTIGFGSTQGVKHGDKVGVTDALVRALQDASKFEGTIKRCVTVPLHQYEYDAYVSLAYNIGPTAFCRKANKQRKNPDGTPNPEPDRFIDVLNAGRYAEACARISSFNKADGRVLRGLTKRRAVERAMCEGK